jgi:hypothetical protein
MADRVCVFRAGTLKVTVLQKEGAEKYFSWHSSAETPKNQTTKEIRASA